MLFVDLETRSRCDLDDGRRPALRRRPYHPDHHGSLAFSRYHENCQHRLPLTLVATTSASCTQTCMHRPGGGSPCRVRYQRPDRAEPLPQHPGLQGVLHHGASADRCRCRAGWTELCSTLNFPGKDPRGRKLVHENVQASAMALR